ncbi:MAG: hydroxyacylglutathione hydrolase [Legionellales bacterium]|nr:hydroxyacylglutathione hydrolase [Legionellales bacterium]
MIIIPLPAYVDNYIWVIINESKHTLCAIDPGDALPVLNYLKNNELKLSNILLTHHHADHAGGVLDLLQTYPDTTVYGPKDTRLPQVNHVVHDEEIIHIDALAFRILNTPGHTSTHICYQEPTAGILFCGDTLFSAGCGRVFDGTMEALHQSIHLLKHLPKDTKVFCGHEYTQQNLTFAAHVEPNNNTISSYLQHLQNNSTPCSLPSTIALEREINPFMRTDKPDIQAYAHAEGISSDDSLAVFRWLREMKNHF